MTAEQTVRLNAFRQLAAANPTKIRIGDKTVMGFIEDVTTDEIEVAGGQADAGGFRAHVAVDDLSEKPNGEEIEANGEEFTVLQVLARNGIVYEITAGDPASE